MAGKRAPLAGNANVSGTFTVPGTPAAPTSKTCGTCGHVDPIPPSIDPSQVRCVNINAMWHAAYDELLTRTEMTRMTLDQAHTRLEADAKSLEPQIEAVLETMDAIREDAERIAQLIGD